MTRRRRRNHRSGVAMLELALCLPVLVLLLSGIVDLGLAAFTLARLTSAVAAGSEFVLLSGRGVDTAAVRTMIEAAADSRDAQGTSLVTATVGAPGCRCVPGVGDAATLVATSCTDTCTDGSRGRYYVAISAVVRYSPMLPLTQVVLPARFAVQSVVPVR